MLIVSGFFLSNVSTAEAIEITVEISGIKKVQGDIRIAIYSTANEFPSETDIYDNRVFPVDGEVVSCTFTVDKPGEYAIALLQDLNKSGNMDYNFVGFPKEPYAFSNNPGIWHRAPTFKECAVQIDKSTKLEIKI